MNRKKILMLAVVVAALGGSAAMLLLPGDSGPRPDLQLSEAAEAAYGRGEYEEADKLFQQTLEATQDSDIASRARHLSSLARGNLAVANIRTMVFQEEKYGQALPLLQDALRQYGSDRDLSAELARLRITVVVADFLERTDKK
jgi:tetratricopeptide (TPR) repeat protein